jgi:HK97 family phage major capsid protein
MSYATKSVSALPPAISLARYARALMQVPGDLDGAAQFAASTWPSTPQVKLALATAFRTKSGIAAGTTTDATWAGPLASSGISDEVLPILRGLSVFDAASPKMRQIPFSVTVPRQTATATGSWIGEGLPTPVNKLTYDALSLPPRKLGTERVLSAELVRASGAAETAVRDDLLAALAAYIDAQFLDPTVALTSTHPASITNGATAVVSSGTTAAAITADLAALSAAVTTPGRGRTWILRPGTLTHIALALGGGAAADAPRTLAGVPILVSENSPPQVTLVDLGEIAYAAGAIDLTSSTQATVEMNSAPTQNATTTPPVGAVMVSLFQNNLVAFHILRFINWQRVRAGSVAYMVTTY